MFCSQKIFLSRVLVVVDAQPVSAREISPALPFDDHRLSANEWESIATVTGTTPAFSGGTTSADIRVAIQAVDKGVLGLKLNNDITATDFL